MCANSSFRFHSGHRVGLAKSDSSSIFTIFETASHSSRRAATGSVFGGTAPRSSTRRLPLVPFEQLARDHEFLDLAGALPDQQERRIAIEAFDRVFGRISVAAVDPQRL